jgi:hypothetical protein
MTCDTATERLLAIPAPTGPDADVAAHLAGCPACTAVAAKVRVLDGLVAALPVVDSTPRKAAFLASLTTGTSLRRPERPWAPFLRHPHVQTAFALAGAILLAVGLYSIVPKGTDRPVVRDLAKHELLAKAVTFAADQADAPTPAKRMASSNAFAGHLLAEIRGVALAVSPGETEAVESLTELFAKTLKNGVIATADGTATLPPLDRKALLDPHVPALAGYAQAARELAIVAPEHLKPLVAKLESSATVAAAHLQSLGAAAASPGPVPGPAGADAGREWALAKANKAVLEVMVSRALKAGAATDAVDRADETRAVAGALETALARAVSEGNADRAAECGEHLATVFVSAVIPAVAEASKGATNPQSPSYERVMALKDRAKADAQRARAALPHDGPVGTHPAVKAARGSLDAATKRLL